MLYMLQDRSCMVSYLLSFIYYTRNKTASFQTTLKGVISTPQPRISKGLVIKKAILGISFKKYAFSGQLYYISGLRYTTFSGHYFFARKCGRAL